MFAIIQIVQFIVLLVLNFDQKPTNFTRQFCVSEANIRCFPIASLLFKNGWVTAV